MVSFLGNVTGQTTKESKKYQNLQLTYEDYARKHKTQRTVGRALLFGGIAMITIGGIMASQEDILYGDESTFALPFVGMVSTISSIPVLISAGANKRKAAYLSLKKESVSYFQNNNSMHNSVPSLSLSIGF